MESTPEQIIQQVEQLFGRNEYQEIIALLNDDLLLRYNNAILYAWRGRIHLFLDELDTAFNYTQKSIELDPSLSIGYKTRGNIWFIKEEYGKAIIDFTESIRLNPKDEKCYYNRGNVYRRQKENDKAISDYSEALRLNSDYTSAYISRANALAENGEYDEAITDFTKAIQLDPKFSGIYVSRGIALAENGEYDKAFVDFAEAIRLDPNNVNAYYNRAVTWNEIDDHDKSLEDYNQTIRLDPNQVNAYINRANLWVDKKKYDKAFADSEQAIRLDPDKANAYVTRGNIWFEKKEYDKALADYEKSIQLDPSDANAYYNRANTLTEKKVYDKAIEDYEQYIKLINNIHDFYSEVALEKIGELKKKIANAWYDEIDAIVNGIKQLLLFDNSCLTHYTSLSSARLMILENKPFRLSEGAFLNDTSEGRELFSYLSFETTKRNNDDTMAEVFVERPFIGSFVADNKHNELTLWRMYGKEAQAEAKGCALTIYKTNFIDNLKKKVSPIATKTVIQSQNEEQFTFYNVAYLSKDTFIVPGKSSGIVTELNALMRELKNKLKNLSKRKKSIINKILNEIAYLFKSSEYQYENEVRLVVQGAGFTKIINKDSNPPKVYIELVDIVPALNMITLGPKVERADEWAAAFNYHIKEQIVDRKAKVDIIISHLPFK